MIFRFLTLFMMPLMILICSHTLSDQESTPAGSTEKTDTSSTSVEANPDFLEIRKAVEDYVAAYNAGKAEKIASLYAENAELIDTHGTTFQGRDVIEKEYAAFFKANPDASISIVVEKVTFVTPTIAMEEGTTTSVTGKDQPGSTSKYVAVYSKPDKGWLLVSVRDQEIPSESDASKLEDLNWLIGQWVDESPDSLMEIDCYWHESGAYLIRDFHIKIEGLLASSGTERIGWDPLKQQIRSWLFDSKGGFLEGTWIRSGDHWTVDTHGYRADGLPIHATYIVTPLRKDAYHMDATNRTAGREEFDDFEMTIVRRSPAPGKVPALDTASNKSDTTDKQE